MTENKDMEATGAVTRRVMLKTAAGAGIALLMAGRSQAAAEQWTAVGKSELFIVGKPKRVSVKDGGVLFITRLDPKAAPVPKGDSNAKPADAKTLVATSAKCTHKGCEVEWAAEASQFQCPCHGAEFASDGKNLHGTRRHPDESLPPLPTLPIREKDGQVEVNLAGAAPDTIEPQGN